ncbi:hypothetical protein D1007_44076 [Hordeum vulgare]|nr:hypothetical protein D1007_44076 [Hordeum vulgare]
MSEIPSGDHSAATSQGTMSSSSAPSPAVSSTSSPPPTVGTNASSSAVSASHFAPLFSSSTPPPHPATPPPVPRHPIFSDHITNHIKFLLNPADHNYYKWKTFFLMVLLRYGFTFLIHSPPPSNASATNLELDAHVALWIYATLSDTMCDHIIGATTTFDLWSKIKDFFLANRDARFMVLNRQYRNLKQGNLSVSDYARRMKLLTDGLADIDHAVSEVDLTMQFLHGLDKRLDTIRVVLGDQSLPFDTVLSRVVLAEESQAQRAAEGSATAFALSGANTTGGPSGPAPRLPHERPANTGSSPAPPSGRGRGDRTGDNSDRGCGRGRGRGCGRHNAPPPPAPFTGYFAPYGMALPAPRPGWIPTNAAGVLGPPPDSHAHAYPMFAHPPPPAAPFHPSPQFSWDHVAMLNAAYSNEGLTAAPAPEWYLDSVASSRSPPSQSHLSRLDFYLSEVDP